MAADICIQLIKITSILRSINYQISICLYSMPLWGERAPRHGSAHHLPLQSVRGRHKELTRTSSSDHPNSLVTCSTPQGVPWGRWTTGVRAALGFPVKFDQSTMVRWSKAGLTRGGFYNSFQEQRERCSGRLHRSHRTVSKFLLDLQRHDPLSRRIAAAQTAWRQAYPISALDISGVSIHWVGSPLPQVHQEREIAGEPRPGHCCPG